MAAQGGGDGEAVIQQKYSLFGVMMPKVFSKQLLVLFFLTLVFFREGSAQNIPETGIALQGTEAFDKEMLQLLDKWKIPGASLAVAVDGRLVLAKAYGYADLEKKISATPNTTFRMGSITKTLTAAAILRLAEQNKLDLNAPILPLLERVNITPKKIIDSRIKDITIKHLLQHSGGMDRNVSGDPVFMPILADISRRQNSVPVTCSAIAIDMLEGKLDFTPGTKFAYSNVGYCVLGKIVEAISGDSFQAYVSRELLMPSIGRSYVIGRSLAPLSDESHYHMMGASKVRSAPGVDESWVDAPYGSYSIENMEAFGAWVASPTDVLKFFLAIDGSRGQSLLNKQGLVAMLDRPSYLSEESRRYYGLGVEINSGPAGVNWFQGGAQPGVLSLALRAHTGNSWVVVFNARPKDSKFVQDYDRALWRAFGSSSNISKGDLFK